MEKRVKITLTATLLIFALLVSRIWYLQIVKGETLTQEAVAQRRISVVETGVRGAILDTNFYPLTSSEFVPMAVISPDKVNNPEIVYKSLSPYSKMEEEKFKEKIKLQIPFCVYLTDYPLSPPFTGVEYMWGQNRYSKDSVAKHILGYYREDENVGAAGLELAFDDILRESSAKNIGVITDARLQEIDGMGFKVTGDKAEERSLKLTLDVSCQNIVEEIAKRSIPKGAVVLLDVENSNILAMVSQPQFDQGDVASYMNSSDGELLNRALCAFDAGSIFKIVVSAAALENGISTLDDPYHCAGAVQIGDKRITCFDGRAHGDVNFFESFTRSCNSFFITIGEKMGIEPILDMAKRFGLGVTNQLYEGSQEQAGGVTKRDKYYSGDIANISIGQGDVMVTPLQAAQLSAIVASGGIRHSINLVDSVVDGNRKAVESYLDKEEERVISRETAEKIQSMMYFTTVVGTAKAANLDLYGGVACKTGTAETGWMENGKTKVHSWITGFFPADSPRYAMAVLVENGQTEGVSATPIFHEIAQRILTK